VVPTRKDHARKHVEVGAKRTQGGRPGNKKRTAIGRLYSHPYFPPPTKGVCRAAKRGLRLSCSRRREISTTVDEKEILGRGQTACTLSSKSQGTLTKSLGRLGQGGEKDKWVKITAEWRELGRGKPPGARGQKKASRSRKKNAMDTRGSKKARKHLFTQDRKRGGETRKRTDQKKAGGANESAANDCTNLFTHEGGRRKKRSASG